jgi:hypothetical protein
LSAGAGPGPDPGREPTEEEYRAALEEEMRRVRVQDLLMQGVVSTLNVGFRRVGVQPGTEGERDLDQARLAIDAVRAHLPLLEQVAPEQMAAIRDALSQLQMAFVRAGGSAPSPADDPAPPPAPAAPAAGAPGGQPSQPGTGSAQSSGRLWVPGR